MLDSTGPTVGILGSYGGRNVGDGAILTSLLDDLHRRRPDARILVFSRHPDHTRAMHPGIEVTARDEESRLVGGGRGDPHDHRHRRPLHESAGPLLAQVDRLWDERPTRVADTTERIGALRARSVQTGERPADVLDNIRPRQLAAA